MMNVKNTGTDEGRMTWDRLISQRRLGLEEVSSRSSQLRSDFRRDYDRIIFSSPFRRLQNKTQVFPLPGSIFVHNRLTHSLEVASVGRSLADEAALALTQRHGDREWTRKLVHLGDIVAAACLAHDIGNPPFGHSGEKTISTYFSEGRGIDLKDKLTDRQWADLVNFEGNANSFRLITHKFVGRRAGGLAMTYSALAATVKYPYGSTFAGAEGKFGFFTTEEDTYRKIADELGIIRLEEGLWARHPLVYLMESADDICYQIMDIEDAHKLKILGTDEVKGLLLAYFDTERQNHMLNSMKRLDDPNEQIAYLRSNVIGALVSDCARTFAEHEEAIMTGRFTGPLIAACEPRHSEAYAGCSRTAWDKIYCADYVVDVEIAGNRIITYLLDVLMEAAIHPERNFSKLMLSKFPKQYDVYSPDLFTRVQAVLDHISGMTDIYALNLFRSLTGDSLPAV